MAAIATGIAALNSLRSLYEIAKEIRNSNDPERLRAAAAEMFDLAMGAREQVAALEEDRNSMIQELAAIKAQVEKAKRFEDEAKRYTRERNQTGAFVYREKDAPEPKSDAPYFCATCFLNEKISILHPAPNADTDRRMFHWICQTCKTFVPITRS